MSSRLIGQVLEGKWRIEAQLGQGGMGTVFTARDLHLERDVAIKFLSRRFADDPSNRLRFEREARVMARLDHPNLVPVYAFGVHDGAPFMVMKRVEGRPLGEHLKGRLSPITVGEVSRIVSQLCDGLSHLHGQGIVHRDIKPSNVLLDAQGHVTLLDYGVARIQAQDGMTPEGSAVGTPRYMAPEQALGQTVDGRADLYSLGVLLFELVTGTPLYPKSSDAELLRAHVTTPPPDPVARNPRVPNALGQVVTRALAKDPALRFASAEAFKAALLEAASAQDVQTMPSAASWEVITTPDLQSPMSPGARKPHTVQLPSEGSSRRGVSVALGAATLLAGGAWLWWSRSSTAPSQPVAAGADAGAASMPPPGQPRDAGDPAQPPLDAGPQVAPRPEVEPPRPRKPGTVRVVLKGWAWVDVDGVRQPFQVPKELVLAPGRHTLRFEREGFTPVERTVTVAPGSSQVLSVQLKP